MIGVKLKNPEFGLTIQSFQQSEKGVVNAQLVDRINRQFYAEINLDNEDVLKIKKMLSNNELDEEETLGKNTQVYDEVASKMIAWRDSILKNPITIEYEIKENENSYVQKSEKFCIEKYDGRYLVISLVEPKETC